MAWTTFRDYKNCDLSYRGSAGTAREGYGSLPGAVQPQENDFLVTYKFFSFNPISCNKWNIVHRLTNLWTLCLG